LDAVALRPAGARGRVEPGTGKRRASVACRQPFQGASMNPKHLAAAVLALPIEELD